MDEIKNEIFEKIKIAREKRYITNCYSVDVVEHCTNVWSYGDEFIFSYEDHGIARLVYFAEDWNAVDKLLYTVKSGHYYLEFMTKNQDEYRPKNAIDAVAMMRLSNPDCRGVFESNSAILRYKDTVKVEVAKEQDVGEINKILWSTFHTEISHLLSDDELRIIIRNGQITVHRGVDNKIDAILQADIMPRKFYINQIVNKGEKKAIHAVLLNRLDQYISAGGKYMYAWVEESNVASLKFHEKYGMKHDGMWDMVYCIER